MYDKAAVARHINSAIGRHDPDEPALVPGRLVKSVFMVAPPESAALFYRESREAGNCLFASTTSINGNA
jgi:hypothetical protein